MEAKGSMGSRNFGLQRVEVEGGEQRGLLHERAEATEPEMEWGRRVGGRGTQTKREAASRGLWIPKAHHFSSNPHTS